MKIKVDMTVSAPTVSVNAGMSTGSGSETKNEGGSEKKEMHEETLGTGFPAGTTMRQRLSNWG